MVKDPVCGMDVDERKSKFKSEYRGKTYYFCCKPCKDAFDRNPSKYLSGQA
ncbi:MAG: YHS domain-containing protein [Candidatus Nezhaarchaeota archaeon]|nr:YHS domain-containing protein [Candidatus Nezhaarchaeota archaeon]MCX8142553.1 YHS domain-containing protein [Candidatus Nezhaarchaeota archaeon]